LAEIVPETIRFSTFCCRSTHIADIVLHAIDVGTQGVQLAPGLVARQKLAIQFGRAGVVVGPARTALAKTVIGGTELFQTLSVPALVERQVELDPMLGAGFAMSPDIRERATPGAILETDDAPVSLAAFGFIEGGTSGCR
jgi:hypothetical protein